MPTKKKGSVFLQDESRVIPEVKSLLKQRALDLETKRAEEGSKWT